MAKYYDTYKTLILVSAFSGIYFPSVDHLIPWKWLIIVLKGFPIIPFLSQVLFLISQIIFLFDESESFPNKIFSISLIFFSIMSLFPIFFSFLHRNDYTRLFETWDAIFADDEYSKKREELLKHESETTNRYFNRFVTISAVPIITYGFLTFFDPKKEIGHPNGIPYRHQSPDLELFRTYDFFVAIFGYFPLLSYDSLTMVFLSYEKAQLLHLKQSLAQILDGIQTTDAGELILGSHSEANAGGKYFQWLYNYRKEQIIKEVEIKIRTWIQHHQKLLRFHKELQRIYGTVLSARNVIFMIVLCFIAFLNTTKSLKLRFIMISSSYCFSNYLFFYVNITYADSIFELSQSLFDEAFAKTWQIYPNDINRLFQIILIRSKQGIRVMTLKIYPLSSKNFVKVLSTAYSIFTFLLQLAK